MMSVQAVMRFPRSNFNNSVNAIEGGEVEPSETMVPTNQTSSPNSQALTPAQHAAVGRNADEIAANAIEGRVDMPGWQNAFTLGPNVRFSRTPQSIFSSKAATAGPEVTAAQTEAAEPASAEARLEVKQQTAPVERRIAKPAILPQPPGATGARALSYRLRRELALRQQQEQMQQAERAAEVVVEAATEAPQNEQIDVACFPAEQVRQPELDVPAFAAYLSDDMFWEAMSLDVDGQIAPAAQPMRLAELARLKAQRLAAAQPPSPAPAADARRITITRQAPPPQIAAPQQQQQQQQQRHIATPRPSFAALGGSAIALYREVGVRGYQPAEVEAAPIAEAAPVQELAPVAEAVEQAPVEVSAPRREMRTVARNNQPMFLDAPVFGEGEYEYPPIDLLQQPQVLQTTTMTPEALEQSAGLLESVLEDFGIKGEIIDVRPGPVVTLYEFEPAPGVKSSRVIGLSDDIARSMSALSARVAVVPGRNVIGIELPNPVRETVYFRELIESPDYAETRMKLALCLGKTIGGEPVVAELAKMPHLLVAGTTGSGKSVAINTMILSLLYRLKPEECRLIMVDPKMLELSVYDGIPHLLTPVVTDPKKAVMALKWAVREMEDRYRKMSRLGVRNIDGYNARAASARAKGETVMCNVQTGFDRATGEAVYEQEEMDLTAMPYIVVIVDEMADLMMVAGKEIEGAIQRLAQMARAAGIHLIMATQRPSVDVITGTIKANFPTRISFQVTSKIDSRTILGEQGAEHLLGQGDMLHMIGGGRIARVHGPFVSDEEVEKVVAHLKTQGRPEYLGTVTEDADEAEEGEEEDSAVFDKTAMAEDDTADLYEKAVKVVLRDKKCSTSYIQRRLSIGYNRAASLVERMEQEGIVGPANHVGKRSIIVGERDAPEVPGAGD
ncbi:DNA translocase FtsK [Agrobacterium larrymoorei]|uniref:DNA translocase FtsK n=1 Tax=Agrobacterium larrymoorei TaxID=160699 RepID=A0A4D7DXY4_9HYPH|nr:DNA translocase FtsK [Agrobacterium larrymoorei]QCJ00348.1 DNA translocase FtsK [Agrobacterium larrymoorei]QYA09207.1 DNA translocase FtsK [Agrobacterium larrymoorei]